MSNQPKKKQRNFGVSSLLASATGRANSEEEGEAPPASADAGEEDGGKPPEAANSAEAVPASDTDTSAAASQRTNDPETQAHQGGHQKTAKGYVRADGTERRRKSLFLPAHQIQALEFLAVRSGYSDKVSQFIAEELDLEKVAREMGFR